MLSSYLYEGVPEKLQISSAIIFSMQKNVTACNLKVEISYIKRQISKKSKNIVFI